MKKSIEEKFEYELVNAISNMQYVLALRTREISNIAWEDFENAELAKGVVAIRIKGANLSGGILIPIPYTRYKRLQKILKLWKKISDEYYKKHGIDIPEIEKNGVKYHPIFPFFGNEVRFSNAVRLAIVTNILLRRMGDYPKGKKN